MYKIKSTTHKFKLEKEDMKTDWSTQFSIVQREDTVQYSSALYQLCVSVSVFSSGSLFFKLLHICFWSWKVMQYLSNTTSDPHYFNKYNMELT